MPRLVHHRSIWPVVLVSVLSLTLLGLYRSVSIVRAVQNPGQVGLGPRLERTNQTLVGVLGPLGSWEQIDIMLNNSTATELPVTPVVFSNGQELSGNIITLQPAETRVVPLRDVVDASRRHLTVDTIQLNYFGFLLDLRTQIVARRAARSGSVDVLFTGEKEFRSQFLNAVWVTPAGGRAII